MATTAPTRVYASVARDVEIDPETGRVTADVATHECVICLQLTFRSEEASHETWPFPCNHGRRIHATCISNYIFRGEGRIRCPVCMADFAPISKPTPALTFPRGCLECHGKWRMYATPAALAQHACDAHGPPARRTTSSGF